MNNLRDAINLIRNRSSIRDAPRVQITRYYCSIQINVCAQRNDASNEMFITRANYYNEFSHPEQTFSTHFDTICDLVHVNTIKQHNWEKCKTSKYTVSYSKTTKIQSEVASFYTKNVFKRNLETKKNLGELTKNLGELTNKFGWVDQSTWVSSPKF